MILLLKIFGSFYLFAAMAFGLLPGAFGIYNFKKTAGKLASILATLFYHALWVVHLLAIYNLWSATYSVWWSFVVPIGLIVLFFATVGRDVGTN